MPAKQSKILIFFLMFTVIAMSAGSILLNKNKVQAQIPVTDVAAVAELGIISGTTAATKVSTAGGWMATIAGWAKDAARWLKEDALKALRDAIVIRIVNMMTDQVVQWVQGGGEPRFITDWEGFLNDSFQAGVGDVINEGNLKFLCRPFNFQLKIALLPVPTFSERVSCTLDDIVANIQDFYDDFRNGSWIAYDSLYEPENNFWGVALMTSIAGYSEGEKQKEAAQQEAQAGKGFLSVKKCVRTGRTDPYDPKTEKCLEYEIVTPGDTVGQVVADAIGAPTDALVNVQGIVSAIVNAAINRVMTEGLSLMKGSGEKTDGRYDIAPPEYDYVGRQELELKKEQMIAEYQKFLNNQQAVLNSKQQSFSNTEQLVLVLNELKNRNCQPPVSDAEITAAQSDIDRLKIEVAELQKIVNEINANINEIRQISLNNRDREMGLVINKYTQFLDKYDYLYDEIIKDKNGFAEDGNRKIAQDEANASQTKLSNAQSRLNLCVLTATP